VFAPEIQDRTLHCWEVDLSRNWANCHKGESLTPAGLRDGAGNCAVQRQEITEDLSGKVGLSGKSA
jgi:hypothetical protein